ncbi:flagellar hook-length control protein FliK [Helicobacter aurati]|uniref:Flagellar hook-length control protein FliK n=1 Tax=Helicobacter aurati TaxID=137778 RepID=A0A3D8JA06_9HELI|nr:flagellar hook-length control protein FliK [Helicobacter aurati]RDU73704.1 flagellar hook-length control protein FliK [Helicobacter aurati]
MVAEINTEIKPTGINPTLQHESEADENHTDSTFAQALHEADNTPTPTQKDEEQTKERPNKQTSTGSLVSPQNNAATVAIKAKDTQQSQKPKDSPLTKILTDDQDINELDDTSLENNQPILTKKATTNTKVADKLPKSSIESTESQDKQKIKPDKTLNDIKKEAEAKNLNLQQIEITQNGKQTKINPEKLFDKGDLEENREKLSNSLQNKGVALAQSISQSLQSPTGLESPEQKKAQLLAELLNHYDSAANAKRKAMNEAEKLEFKISNGDKSAIIQRNTQQPKNIIESILRNEERQNEFLEKLHEITGDEDLGDLVDLSKAKAKALAQISLKNMTNKIDSPVQTNPLNPIQQAQSSTELIHEKTSPFEFDTNKAFDEVLTQNLKADSMQSEKEKEMNLAKESTKVEEKSKEKIDSKVEAGNLQAKQEVTMKSALAKEAIRNFASQFREEILNYKPPITKINVELNPASLGQVSLSIAKKGKDLQVSITSNANVMTMFVQNAQDLRQNLMQIGFNNLDLNFSSHENNENQQQANQQQQPNEKLLSVEEAQELTTAGNVPSSLEILLPEYV